MFRLHTDMLVVCCKRAKNSFFLLLPCFLLIRKFAPFATWRDSTFGSMAVMEKCYKMPEHSYRKLKMKRFLKRSSHSRHRYRLFLSPLDRLFLSTFKVNLHSWDALTSIFAGNAKCDISMPLGCHHLAFWRSPAPWFRKWFVTITVILVGARQRQHHTLTLLQPAKVTRDDIKVPWLWLMKGSRFGVKTATQ